MRPDADRAEAEESHCGAVVWKNRLPSPFLDRPSPNGTDPQARPSSPGASVPSVLSHTDLTLHSQSVWLCPVD